LAEQADPEQLLLEQLLLEQLELEQLSLEQLLLEQLSLEQFELEQLSLEQFAGIMCGSSTRRSKRPPPVGWLGNFAIWRAVKRERNRRSSHARTISSGLSSASSWLKKSSLRARFENMLQSPS
jgi:hypothetical protein